LERKVNTESPLWCESDALKFSRGGRAAGRSSPHRFSQLRERSGFMSQRLMRVFLATFIAGAAAASEMSVFPRLRGTPRPHY
jgi:hypothetical protein